jgi:hypothetical protein
MRASSITTVLVALAATVSLAAPTPTPPKPVPAEQRKDYSGYKEKPAAKGEYVIILLSLFSLFATTRLLPPPRLFDRNLFSWAYLFYHFFLSRSLESFLYL